MLFLAINYFVLARQTTIVRDSFLHILQCEGNESYFRPSTRTSASRTLIDRRLYFICKKVFQLSCHNTVSTSSITNIWRNAGSLQTPLPKCHIRVIQNENINQINVTYISYFIFFNQITNPFVVILTIGVLPGTHNRRSKKLIPSWTVYNSSDTVIISHALKQML